MVAADSMSAKKNSSLPFS